MGGMKGGSLDWQTPSQPSLLSLYCDISVTSPAGSPPAFLQPESVVDLLSQRRFDSLFSNLLIAVYPDEHAI